MLRLVKFASLFLVSVSGIFASVSNFAPIGNRPASMDCTVDILHEFRAQDGTLLSTESYQKVFTVTEGTDFVDDYSTITRQKVFSAVLTNVRGELVLDANWFSDVSVFNSVDLDASLTLTKSQKSGKSIGGHTFSSPPGHDSTNYTIIAVRK